MTQPLGAVTPMVVQAAENETVVFHDFEGESSNSNLSGALNTEYAHNGNKSLCYSNTGDYAGWNVTVTAKNETVDITNQNYITFWVKDEGANSVEVTLYDEDGHESSKVWTSETSVAGEWTKLSIPLSMFDFATNGVDKSKISKIAFYEWNEGIYYLDDIQFEKAIDFTFADFEGISNASGTFVTQEKHTGYKSLRYTNTGTYNEWNVEVAAGNGSVDISEENYITFWVKDTGANTVNVKLIDGNGRETDDVWTEEAGVAGEWTKLNIPLSAFDFETNEVDKTDIAKIAFWEMEQGTYYIDDVEFVKELTNEVTFHDFESETITGNASGSLSTEQIHDGNNSLKYDKTGEYATWNVEISAKESAVDVSDMDELSFWIYDTASNTVEVTLVDAEGNKTGSVWTSEAGVAGEWTQIRVPMSSFDFDTNNVDKTQIQTVAFYEYTEGTYYIDDIQFVQKTVFQDFEGIINENGTIETEDKHTGTHAVKYTRTESNSDVRISGKNGAVDLTYMDNISFWVKDEGSNNIEVKFIDTNGKETAGVWTPDDEKTVAGEWSQMKLALSEIDFDTNEVDITSIAQVGFYEWNPGTYYIDDICFNVEDVIEEDGTEDEVMKTNAAWMQDFEGANTVEMYVAAETGTSAMIEEGMGCLVEDAESKCLVYEKLASASPEVEDGSVLIHATEPMDTTGYRYLIFYIKDQQGSNTLKVSLVDADGNETDFGANGWCEVKTTKGEWKQYYVALDKLTGTIDRTRVSGIRIGQWNQGTYLIDNVYLDNYLFTGTPDSGITLPEVQKGEVAASKETGKYTEGFGVELIAGSEASIYYSTDGTTPTINSKYAYDGVINITETTTIKAIAVEDGVAGDVYTFTYLITPYPVTATSVPGTYTDSAVVEFRTKDSNDLIYYTTDGSIPARGEGTTVQYIKPLQITESTTFRAIAYKPGSGTANDPVELSYVIHKSEEANSPKFSVLEGTYGDTVEVEITAEGDIYYTLDGSEPTTASTPYTTKIAVNENTTIRAISVEGENVSETVTAEYVINKEETPFLKADGKVLRDQFGTGDVITLRGTNAGGWLATENWQCPTNAPDQLSAQTVYTERFGAAVSQELIDLYQDGWWTEDDFDLVKAEGMNMLRLPITHFEMLNEDGTLKETAFDRMEWFIQNCEERGLYVLIDMHGAVGSQNGKDHSGDITIPDVGDYYGNEENIQKTVALWEEIARRYKDNPWVCGYDLLNEPSAVGTPQFEEYDRLYDAIRAIDTNHVIYMQAIWEPTHLPNPDYYDWKNVAYQYHFYGWHVEQDAEGQLGFIEDKVKMVNEDTNYNVPLLVGEFTFFSNLDSWKAMDYFEEQGWSYTSWTWKVTGAGSSWGVYTSDHEKVDIYKDSEEVIREKWALENLATTTAFTRNTEVADILKSYYENNESNKPGTTIAEGIDVVATLSIEEGKSQELEASVVPATTAYKTLRYASDDESVVTVDETGKVTAKTEGTAEITISNLYGMTATCAVTVTAEKKEPEEVPGDGSTEGTEETPGDGSTEGTEETPGDGSTEGTEETPGDGSTEGTEETPGDGSTEGTEETPGDGSTEGTEEVPGDGSTEGTEETPGDGSTEGTEETPGDGSTEGTEETPGGGSTEGTEETPGGGSTEGTPGGGSTEGTEETPGSGSTEGTTITPGGNTGGGTTTTPGGNTGGTTTTPGENTGGTTTTPGGSTGTPSIQDMTQTITANKTEKDVEGSVYGTLGLRVAKRTKNSIKIKWNKVKGADGYLVFANKCGQSLKLVKTIKKAKVTSYTNKKLKKSTYYKYMVVAYKTVGGKQVTVSASKLIHTPTAKGKYTDVKALKLNKTKKVTLKKGATLKLKAKEKKAESGKKLSRHRKVCYESSNSKVATVSKSGKIKAKSKGNCYIYAYAQNGVSKKLKVVVK